MSNGNNKWWLLLYISTGLPALYFIAQPYLHPASPPPPERAREIVDARLETKGRVFRLGGAYAYVPPPAPGAEILRFDCQRHWDRDFFNDRWKMPTPEFNCFTELKDEQGERYSLVIRLREKKELPGGFERIGLNVELQAALLQKDGLGVR